jgi:hypothetical protein
MRSHAHRRAILIVIVPMLVSCATAPVHAPGALDLAEAEPDPLAFLGIAFPAGVPVRASVITTQPAGITSEVLACVEHENVVGFVPHRDVDFVNLYLVRQSPGSGPMQAPPRYLVAELWHYRPTAGVKIRHQWVIWQDDPPLPPSRAEYAVLIEDFTNRVIEERTAGIEPGVLGELARFYADAVEFFTEHPPENTDAAGPVAFGGPYAVAWPQSVTSCSSPQAAATKRSRSVTHAPSRRAAQRRRRSGATGKETWFQRDYNYGRRNMP